MPRPSRRRPLFLAALALTALVAGACVQPDAPDVGVSKIEAKLVFGAKPEPEPEKTIGSQIDQIVADDLVVEADLDLSSFKPPPPFLGPDINKRESDCPEAPSGSAARDAAGVNVEGPARNGVARWKRAGFIKDGDQQLDLAGFDSRIVRNAQKVSEGVYTYETVQPTLGIANQFLISYFRVNTDKFNRDPSAGVGTVSSPVRAGEPDRGLVLLKTEVRDRQNKLIGNAFQPTTPILLLPLPVTSGEQWESVGVDPRTGETITHSATVHTVRTLDACGKLMIGWFVDATQTYSAASPANNNVGHGSVRYQYLVATQYGGQLIQERFQPTSGDAFDLTFSQAQVDPDPLPGG